MVTTKPLILNPLALYELIVQPQFADLMDGFTGSYNGTLSEFTLYDEVSLGRGTPIVDIFGKRNILQRKDRSCKTNWKQIAKGSTRRITIDELYGAVEDCQEEFYQGCLKDWREMNPMFRQMVLSQFKKAIGMDITCNSYFGDIARADDTTDTWSWNKFDGIFTKYAEYYGGTNNAYKPQMLSAIPSGTITPSNAYAIFQAAFNARTDEMRAQLSTDLAFYVDEDLAEALRDYYVGVGYNTAISESSVNYLMNGLPVLKFKNIPVFVEPTWRPILTALDGGSIAHAIILTIRGNFIYGMNKNYGGGAELNQAMRVWFSEDDEVWRYKMHLTGGTELASPQNTIMGLTNIT